MADRTLAERARDASDPMNMARGTNDGGWIDEAVAVLTALADENDTLRDESEAWVEANVELAQHVIDADAERDRYWNLAEQLATAMEHELEPEQGFYQSHDDALAAFRAEKDSRDV